MAACTSLTAGLLPCPAALGQEHSLHSAPASVVIAGRAGRPAHRPRPGTLLRGGSAQRPPAPPASSASLARCCSSSPPSSRLRAGCGTSPAAAAARLLALSWLHKAARVSVTKNANRPFAGLE